MLRFGDIYQWRIYSLARCYWIISDDALQPYQHLSSSRQADVRLLAAPLLNRSFWFQMTQGRMSGATVCLPAWQTKSA